MAWRFAVLEKGFAHTKWIVCKILTESIRSVHVCLLCVWVPHRSCRAHSPPIFPISLSNSLLSFSVSIFSHRHRRRCSFFSLLLLHFRKQPRNSLGANRLKLVEQIRSKNFSHYTKKNYAIHSGLLPEVNWSFGVSVDGGLLLPLLAVCIIALNIMKIKLFHKPLSSNTINFQQNDGSACRAMFDGIVDLQTWKMENNGRILFSSLWSYCCLFDKIN